MEFHLRIDLTDEFNTAADVAYALTLVALRLKHERGIEQLDCSAEGNIMHHNLCQGRWYVD